MNLLRGERIGESQNPFGFQQYSLGKRDGILQQKFTRPLSLTGFIINKKPNENVSVDGDQQPSCTP